MQQQKRAYQNKPICELLLIDRVKPPLERPTVCARAGINLLLDGGHGALVIGFFVETSFEASKALYLEAFTGLKKCLLTKARLLKHDLHFHGCFIKASPRFGLPIFFFVRSRWGIPTPLALAAPAVQGHSLPLGEWVLRCMPLTLLMSGPPGLGQEQVGLMERPCGFADRPSPW